MKTNRGASASESPTEPSAGERALAYLRGDMDAGLRARFEEELAGSESLREELERSRAVLNALSGSQERRVVALVGDLLTRSIERGASDLHLVPQRDCLLVRHRIDGFLVDAEPLSRDLLQPVIDRIKVLTGMQLSERRLPQDGRAAIAHEGIDYDVRVNVLPTLYGERATLRFLSRGKALMGLENLNLSPGPLAALQRISQRGSGLILTTGATGVGKTTLLYSLMQAMQAGRPGRSFMTVEDPIEYALGGVSQTAISLRSGLTFAAALRSAMRCDPDVVLVGDIRDRDTAEASAQLALTGHLVISAVPTHSAIGAIERLLDLGLDAYKIADTLAGVIGQRLVRRIDSRQTEEYLPDTEELSRAGISPEEGPFRRGVASGENGGTGFHGRIPLTEVVEVTPGLRRTIACRATYEETWRAAFSAGVPSLPDDARSRVRAALTTVEETNWALFDYVSG